MHLFGLWFSYFFLSTHSGVRDGSTSRGQLTREGQEAFRGLGCHVSDMRGNLAAIAQAVTQKIQMPVDRCSKMWSVPAFLAPFGIFFKTCPFLSQ